MKEGVNGRTVKRSARFDVDGAEAVRGVGHGKWLKEGCRRRDGHEIEFP